MKIRLRLLAVAVALGLFLMPAATVLAAVPVVPLLYQGSVSIEGVDAPTGTIITAEIEGEEVATNAPDGTTAVGTYTLAIVANEGDVVVLKVNGVPGGQDTHPDPMTNYKVDLDLSVGEAPPPSLTANAGMLTYYVAVGEEITLEGSASGGTEPYTYAWDLDNDGTYETAGATPSHSWDTAGTYPIVLQVTDYLSATDTDTATVLVTEEAFDPTIYDTDEDGVMSKDETLAAVNDYLADNITKNQALEVVKLYFS